MYLSDCTGINYFVIRFDDDSRSVEVYDSDCTMSRFFHDVSEVLAFGDCTGNDVVSIVFHGVEYVYEGWLPGELYRYVGKINHHVYEACYPEFDH